MSGVNIFLSYRRSDSGYAGRLADHINRHFPDSVFRDVTGIDPGTTFTQVLERKLDSCHVLIVVISPTWLEAKNKDGRRRLDDERDFVRMEVRAGLRRAICVIPVLVNGAAQPEAHELPDDIEELASRQSMAVSERDFAEDVRDLCAAISRVTGRPMRDPDSRVAPPPPPPPSSFWKKLLVAGVLGGALLVFGLAVIDFLINDPKPSPTLNENVEPTRPVITTNTQPPNPPPEAEDDGFFRPVGRWVLKSGADPNSIDLTLAGDRTYVAVAQGPGLNRTTRGSWVYLSDDRLLVLTGQDEYGNPTADRLQILRPHDDHYHVMYPGVGEVEMWPR